MPVYLYTADVSSAETTGLTNRIRRDIPHLRTIASLKDLPAISEHQAPRPDPGKSYVLLAIAPNDSIFGQVASIAAQHRDQLFFIFISNDISANDYKRLVRLGNADWVSVRTASQEILDIIARDQVPASASETRDNHSAAIAVFVPSAGGVGNSTIAIEAAVQLKSAKETQSRAVCLIDLDFQTSHVSDMLDIEPRLQIAEIARNPERVDAQLCDSFVTQHASGLDVMAVPQNKNVPEDLDIAVLDALFGIISQRYDLILIDLPVQWVSWTRQIIGVAELAIVTGLPTIPCLRQAVAVLEAVRANDPIPPQIVVALNRCRRRLFGFSGEPYAKRMLKDEKVLFVREDAVIAQHSVNTGIPMATGAPSSVISRDIRQVSSLLSTLKPSRVTDAENSADRSVT